MSTFGIFSVDGTPVNDTNIILPTGLICYGNNNIINVLDVTSSVTKLYSPLFDSVKYIVKYNPEGQKWATIFVIGKLSGDCEEKAVLLGFNYYLTKSSLSNDININFIPREGRGNSIQIVSLSNGNKYYINTPKSQTDVGSITLDQSNKPTNVTDVNINFIRHNLSMTLTQYSSLKSCSNISTIPLLQDYICSTKSSVDKYFYASQIEVARFSFKNQEVRYQLNPDNTKASVDDENTDLVYHFLNQEMVDKDGNNNWIIVMVILLAVLLIYVIVNFL
jgi:hypothetical protein